MDLLQDTHKANSLSGQVKVQAAQLHALELQGFAEGDQPKDPEQLALEAAEFLGGLFTSANQFVTSETAGVPRVVAVPENGALVRQGAKLLAGLAADKNTLLARSNNELKFRDSFKWAIAEDIMLAEVWRFEVFTGTDTTANDRMVGVFDNVSSALTITLNDPPYNCKAYFIYDSLGEIDATDTLTIDADNGNVNGASSVGPFTTTRGMWICIGNRESGGAMRWIVKEL